MTVGIPTSDFDEMKDLEVMTFRRNILDTCRKAVDDRQRKGRQSVACYVYPPDVETSDQLPKHLQEKLRSACKHNFI